MMHSDDLTQHEMRLALLRRSLDRLEGGAPRLARAGEAGTTAEVIEAVRREMAALEAATGKLRGEGKPAQRRDGLRGMTPAVAFCLAS